MNKILLTLTTVVAAAGAAAAACTVNSTTNNQNQPGDDGGPGDGSAGDTASPEASTPTAYVRFADWSPDSTGLQICYATHGSTAFQLAAGDTDGGTGQLSFPTVSGYAPIPVGQYDIEVVAAGATDCSTPLPGSTNATNLPTLAQDGFYTLAIVGDTAKPTGSNDPGLAVVGLVDDTSPTGGNVSVRFVNAAPSLSTTPLDFGTNALSSNFALLETNVGYGTTPTLGSDAGAQPDPQGYVSFAAPTGAIEISAHTSSNATADTATASNVMVPGNWAYTFVLVYGKTGGTGPSFLMCSNDGTATATCQTIP
jgi:hypothetical protein